MVGPLARLSVQIALGPVLVIALVGGAMLWPVEAGLQRQAEARFDARVKLASMQLEDRVKTDVELRVVGAGVLASQPNLVAALIADSTDAVEREVFAYVARTRLEAVGASGLRVYGPTGALLVRAEAPGRDAPQRVLPPEVVATLRTGAPFGGVRRDETLGVSVSGIAPVRAADGRTIAAVEAISALDATFASRAATLLDADVAVLTGGQVSATSPEAPSLDAASLTDDLRQRAQERPVDFGTGETRSISGIVTYRDFEGAVIGDLYVGLNRSLITASVRETRSSIVRTMGFALMMATVATGIFGWVAMRPLGPLLAAAGRLQQNDLESPVPAGGPTEIRRLGEAMEDLRLAIRQSRDALQRANRDLARRISTSDASLSEVTRDLDVMQAVVSELAGESAGGLPGVVDRLLELGWVDGAFIAIATPSGELSTAAAAGLPPQACAAVLTAVGPRLAGTSETELVFADTAGDRRSERFAVWRIRSLAVTPMVTPDGVAGIVCVTSERPMALTPQRRELLRSIAREVTATLERSELADEVEENRRVAEAVLREMADGVIVVDHDHVCRICNPAAAALLGLPRAQIIGHPVEDWLHLDGVTIEGLRERARQGTRGIRLPLLVHSADRPLAITAGRFPDPDPSRFGVILLIRDLSAEVEADRVKRDFVSMVGHELRTPLTLIRTTIDLLHDRDAGALNATQERIVEVLHQNSDRLMSLISDLLDMSALDSGRMQIAPAATNLGATVQRAVRAAGPAMAAHGHRLHVSVPDEVMVWADGPRVEQVLANLLSNAIKYTPPGGDIEVRVEDSSPYASVSVADNGIGITPEEQVGLFEKFYRTGSGRRATGGTGLGLAIARSIVDLHGGSIRCDSDGLHGTRFTFTLPRRPL